MNSERSLVDIFNDADFGIRNTGYSDHIKPVPSYITDNLKHKPYYFQSEALENFIFYMESPVNPVTQVDFRKDRNKPVHLMFNMATGSGKTLVMAANILYLLKQGYKKFLFVTNQTNILNKTRENISNVHHQKYLFTPKINLDSKFVNIKEVEKFSNSDNIEIRYTTIHKLHTELSPNNLKENINTQDDLSRLDLAILADEAHHFNADSNNKSKTSETNEFSKPEDIEQNWEYTLINKVLNKNFLDLQNKNILLEFTATVPDTEMVEKKYLDKTIYKFDLKEFMKAKHTKEINLITHNLDRKEKIIYALAFNWFRHKIAIKNNIPNFKPVILFRRKTIEDSKSDFEYFFEVIENLELNDLNFIDVEIPKNINKNSIHEQGLSRTKQVVKIFEKDSLKKEFIQFVKNNFKRDVNVVITNSERNKLKREEIDNNLEKKLNNLESPNNNIRAIFTVKRLTEGWDVQNLYDIVRMDTTQNTGGSTKKTPQATIEEKQLIGRAVRFNPYKINNDVTRSRKFDDNLENELRILEEFFYFTYDEDNRYISELKAELIKDGYIKESNEIINFHLKKSFIKNNFYKKHSLWVNSQINGEKYYLDSVREIEKIVEITLPNLSISQDRLGVDLVSVETSEINNELFEFETSLKNFDNHMILKSLIMQNKTFNELRQLLKIDTLDKLNENKQLNEFKLRISSQYNNLDSLSGDEKLFILDNFFNHLLVKMSTLLNKKYGDTSFNPVLLSDFFVKSKQKSIDIENFNLEQVRIYNLIHSEPWYVVEATKNSSNEKLDFYPLTNQEIYFLDLFKKTLVPKIKNISKEFYLIRNEEQLKLFDFETGEGFMPDFLLFIKISEDLVYLIFIEPKGLHLFEQDKWKEDFLFAIDSLYGLSSKKLKVDNKAYHLIGLPFYNSESSEKFREKFTNIYS